MAIGTKSELRVRLLAARKAVPAEVRVAEAVALTTQLARLAAGAATVCAYVPVGTEPGSLAMLDAMAQTGARVLLPVAIAEATPLPLRWGEYRPSGLVRAGFGLLEPDGPRLPPEEIATADLIIVPALAVDWCGVRLGRGAGFYDRSLPLRAPGASVIAVVRDDELVDQLPADPHDVRMTHAVTPGGGVARLAG